MPLTPADVHNVVFKKPPIGKRGYDEDEVDAFLDVVEAELGRLVTRVPEMDDRVRGEIAQTVRRVVDKLLHEPTVRVKRLAASPAGDHYAEALRELFDLNPKVPEAVTRADVAEVETDVTGNAGEEDA